MMVKRAKKEAVSEIRRKPMEISGEKATNLFFILLLTNLKPK